jgi:hypothetical protein
MMHGSYSSVLTTYAFPLHEDVAVTQTVDWVELLQVSVFHKLIIAIIIIDTFVAWCEEESPDGWKHLMRDCITFHPSLIIRHTNT